MPNLKELKNRIASVKSTRKITSAMKMVAASKLRRAQEQAEAARPYSVRMANMLASLAGNLLVTDMSPRLLAGSGKQDVVLLIVVTSDRGLCGAFNGSIVREARRQIRQMETEGKTVKLLCLGRKGRDLLRRDHGEKIVQTFETSSKGRLGYAAAEAVRNKVVELFEAGQFDVAKMVFNQFKSVLAQVVTLRQLVPLAVEPEAQKVAVPISYDFEPEEEAILAKLLPQNLAVQIFAAMLESAAGEQAARMTAMDNATRNAGDMINKLTLYYNRSRQAYITKELIEIISGAEAV